MIKLKNLLADQMIRHGIKNLSESQKQYFRRILSEQEQATTNAIVYASTSPENMPNSENVAKNGLPEPTDKTKFPDLERTVFRMDIKYLFQKDDLSYFSPVRVTKTPMDVLKFGNQGGDFAIGQVGSIEFTDTDTGIIEASHNGLLAIARAIDAYKDNGRPKPTKFILKMGQAKRYGNILEYGDLNVLNLTKPPANSSQVNSTATRLAVILIPSDKLTNNHPIGRDILPLTTIDQRVDYLKRYFGNGLPYLQKIIARDSIPKATVDLDKFVRSNYGKSLDDATVISAANTVWTALLNHYYNTIKTHYDTWESTTGITVPGLKELLADIQTVKVLPSLTKEANDVLLSPKLKMAPAPSPSPNVSGTSGEYKIGQSKN